ncbi:MAG: phosphatase PAP2 family protein [Spirochaetaceae bacterium]|nr:phosphatase PAP2 family protein [Spirochaetaceae bacterium]
MKKIISIIVFVSCVFTQAAGQEKDVFKIDWVTDGIIIGSVITVNTAGFLLEDKTSQEMPGLLSVDTINTFDRWSAFPYSKAADVTSDIFQYASFLLPAVLFTTGMDQWITIGVMYAEASLLSFGLKNMGKSMINRYRPYNYFPGAPEQEDNDFVKSHPSGHTTMAFTGAAFASYTFSQYFPDSPWKIPVIAGSYVFAGTTAALRIKSGSHFFSDVLSGAVIGTLSGFLIPYIHKAEKTINEALSKNSEIEYSFALNPSYCSFSLKF